MCGILFSNDDIEENASRINSIVLPLCNSVSGLCALCVHWLAVGSSSEQAHAEAQRIGFAPVGEQALAISIEILQVKVGLDVEPPHGGWI